MPVTLKDIAARVGVSQVAVSQVMRGKGAISAETRRRVMEVATELRYRPNGMALSMRRGRTGIVGLIYSSAGTLGNLPLQQLSGIQTALSEMSFDLMLAEVHGNALVVPDTAASLLRHWMADGMLINNQLDLPPAVAELVDEAHVPAVWMNSRLKQNCVYFDEEDAGLRATRRLIEAGHRSIDYLDMSHARSSLDNPTHHSVTDRIAGYVRAMTDAGLTPRLGMDPTKVIEPPERAAFCAQWLDRPDRPTAVVTYGTGVANALIYAATCAGLRIPRDLSIITFSKFGDQAAFDGEVTSLLQDFHELGRASVDQMMTRLKAISEGQAANIPIEPVVLKMKLNEGNSIAPPVVR